MRYADLDARSNQGAHLFRSLGLTPGAVVAIQVENGAEFFELVWAAQRSGLYYVCLSTKLSSTEVDYILADSGAKLFLVSKALADADQRCDIPMLIIGSDGSQSFERARAAMPDTPITDEQAGFDMLYSSGTTGRPKGIRPREVSGEPITAPDPTTDAATQMLSLIHI